MTSPALDRPFLTTREIFTLKLDQWPALAQRYVTADEPGRRALLASTVDRAPLPAVEQAGTWITPRDIDRLEYFASAGDLCRAYTSLAALDRQPGLAPIGRVLSLNDDGLQLDPAQWQTTWFKGGSEPGVLTLAFLATTRSGHSYVVTVLAENKSQPIDQGSASAGHSLGGQGRVHARGPAPTSAAAGALRPGGGEMNFALAGHIDDHAFALQDLQGAGGHPVRDMVMLGDRADRRDPAGHGPLGYLVSQHLGDLLIRRYRRVRVDHMGQHSRWRHRWQDQPGAARPPR